MNKAVKTLYISIIHNVLIVGKITCFSVVNSTTGKNICFFGMKGVCSNSWVKVKSITLNIFDHEKTTIE